MVQTKPLPNLDGLRRIDNPVFWLDEGLPVAVISISRVSRYEYRRNIGLTDVSNHQSGP